MNRWLVAVVLVFAIAGLARLPIAADPGRGEERFEFRSYVEVQELFERLEYTPETWQAGLILNTISDLCSPSFSVNCGSEPARPSGS